MTTITDEQIAGGVAQLQSMKGRARSGEYRDIVAHDNALNGIACALQARNGAGMRAHAERLDAAAAYVGENCDDPHRRVVARAVALSLMV